MSAMNSGDSSTLSVHKAHLQRWEGLLLQQGFIARLLLASDQVPYSTLLVRLTEEGKAPPLQLELSFVPGMEEQLEGGSLLQCFVHLPVTVEAPAERELARLILQLNSKLPLVGFGYLEAERMPFFRHVLMLAGDNGAMDALFMQTTWMISYLLEQLAEPVAMVATGSRSMEQALGASALRDVFQ